MLKAIPVSYLTPIQKTALLMIFKGTGRISQTYLQAQAQEEAGQSSPQSTPLAVHGAV